MVRRLLPANSLNHTRKSCRREGLFSFSWTFPSGGRSSASRLRSWRVNAGGQSPDELRFCLSHFPHRRTSSKRIGGPRAAPRLSCEDVRDVKLIRSSATDAAASKRMMGITIGLTFVAAAAPVAREPSPSCRCFLPLTRTTVCWHAARHCGGASSSTAPGKRHHLRSKTLTVCPILPRSAAGPTAWTAPNRHFPFSTKRSPAWFTGWRVAIPPFTKLGLCPG
jgi:hypothetical protein